MASITVQQWADAEGISKQAAYERLKRLGVRPVGGKLDADAVKRAWGRQRDVVQQQRGAHSRGSFGPAKRRKDAGANGDLGPKLPSNLPALGDAQIAETLLKVKERQIKIQKLEGTLVNAEEVSARVEGRFREDSQALLDWPARISAEMAAELGTEERLTHAVLDKYVRQFMRERSVPVVRGS